eukprot:Em0018g678a
MPSRNEKKRSKQRAEYLQKQDDILSQENKAKARARYKADPEKKASVRDSYKADPEKKKASVRDSYNADIESKQSAKGQRYQEDVEENRAAKRQRYQEDVEENRAAKRQRYQEDVEENRAAKRQRNQEDVEENRAAKRQRNQEDVETAKRQTIQLPLRHLKGIGIGMTPLSDWLNVLPRGSGIAWVTELPLPPKGLSTENNHILLPNSYSLYEPKSHALMEYNGGLEKAILRDTQKVVTRSARAAVRKIGAPLAAATTTHMTPMARTRPPRQ